MFQAFQLKIMTKVKKYTRTQSCCTFPSKAPLKIFQSGFCSKFSTIFCAVPFYPSENVFIKRETVFSRLRISKRNHSKRATEATAMTALLCVKFVASKFFEKISLFFKFCLEISLTHKPEFL